MKVVIASILAGMLLLCACGQNEPEQASASNTATAAPAATLALPAGTPNASSRLQQGKEPMPYPNDTFRIYGLGGLAASSTRTAEQYQRDVSDAVARNLAARLSLAQSEVQIVRVQENDAGSCGGKQAGPQPDERTPGLEIVAQAGGVSYRYIASGALAQFCGQVAE